VKNLQARSTLDRKYTALRHKVDHNKKAQPDNLFAPSNGDELTRRSAGKAPNQLGEVMGKHILNPTNKNKDKHSKSRFKGKQNQDFLREATEIDQLLDQANRMMLFGRSRFFELIY
jgi:hypothetical protein